MRRWLPGVLIATLLWTGTVLRAEPPTGSWDPAPQEPPVGLPLWSPEAADAVPADVVRSLDAAGNRPAWEPGFGSLSDLGQTTKGSLGSWTCWTLVGDARQRRDDPLAGGWRTDDSWNMSVAGPF